MDETSHAGFFIPDVLREGLDMSAAWNIATKARDIFLPGVVDRLRARDTKRDAMLKPV